MEETTIRNPTACKEMEHCHFFESKILIEVMQSLTDVNIYDKEGDMEADIGKYLSFFIVTLKTAILIAEGIFDHYVNDCIFQEILERKIAIMEKDAGQIYNENTVIALVKGGINVAKCIEI